MSLSTAIFYLCIYFFNRNPYQNLENNNYYFHCPTFAKITKNSLGGTKKEKILKKIRVVT